MANQEVIQKWTEALRSGEYVQVEGKLRKDVDGGAGYCCLGVLCEIAVAEGVIPPATRAVDGFGYEHSWFEYGPAGDINADELPRKVMEWAGLPSTNPEVEFELTPEERADYATYDVDDETLIVPDTAPTVSEDTLAELNDSFDRNFSEIADAIEANFLGQKS